MYERVGINNPCLVGLCRGSGYLGWQHPKLQKSSVHGQTDMKQLMEDLLERLMLDEMDLFWA